MADDQFELISEFHVPKTQSKAKRKLKKDVGDEKKRGKDDGRLMTNDLDDRTDQIDSIRSDLNQKITNSDCIRKRGQKSKLKKIKNKYIDQDESERLLRMKLLQVGLFGNLFIYL